MYAPRKPRPETATGRKGKTPAERAEEFAATQRQLKREAASRRALAERLPAGETRRSAPVPKP